MTDTVGEPMRVAMAPWLEPGCEGPQSIRGAARPRARAGVGAAREPGRPRDACGAGGRPAVGRGLGLQPDLEAGPAAADRPAAARPVHRGGHASPLGTPRASSAFARPGRASPRASSTPVSWPASRATSIRRRSSGSSRTTNCTALGRSTTPGGSSRGRPPARCCSAAQEALDRLRVPPLAMVIGVGCRRRVEPHQDGDGVHR